MAAWEWPISVTRRIPSTLAAKEVHLAPSSRACTDCHSAPLTAVAYSTQLACPVHVDVDYQVVLRKQHGSNPGKIQAISVHRGPVWASLAHANGPDLGY